MLESPPASRQPIRKRTKANQANRVQPGFAAASGAPKTPQSAYPARDRLPASLKAELALWRAFLGDEIDAILRDKD
jgi:hypothetical protein